MNNYYKAKADMERAAQALIDVIADINKEL